MQLEHAPELIQQEQKPYKGGKPATPIFLIHDGGGTTFAYHCMNTLDRYIFGIGNPYFYSPETFDGSLAELGELYAGWIKTAVSKRGFPIRRANDGRIQIYLGGWSLGGMLSLEVAKRLADDENIKVAGILMVDSIYPGGFRELFKRESPEEPPEEGLSKNEMLSRRCMTQARRMVGGWEVPVWDGEHAGTRPKSVLLQATQYVPTGADPFRIHGLDKYRETKELGWCEYDKNMFTQVFPVEGHHFDMFTFDRVDETTKVIKRALERLDKETMVRRWTLW